MTDQTPSEATARDHAATTEQTREIVNRFVQAWFSADADRMVTLLDKDASWRPPASIAPTITGRDRIATGLAGAAAGQYVKLETLRRTVNSMAVDGTKAVVLVHLEAETLLGASYVNEYSWFFECDDTVVTRITEYADTLHAARLGFVPFRPDEDGSQ